MARDIVEKHGFKEKETAQILGLSQSAVSRYLTKDRGNQLEVKNADGIQPLIDQMVTFLIHEPHKKMEIMNLFCQTCQKIRENGLMCELCHKEMTPWSKDCSFCNSP